MWFCQFLGQFETFSSRTFMNYLFIKDYWTTNLFHVNPLKYSNQQSLSEFQQKMYTSYENWKTPILKVRKSFGKNAMNFFNFENFWDFCHSSNNPVDQPTVTFRRHGPILHRNLHECNRFLKSETNRSAQYGKEVRRNWTQKSNSLLKD